MKIRNSSGQSSSGLTLYDALFNPRYRKSTWVNIGYLIFHELTGINVIILYSSAIFQQMSTPDSKFTPKTGTYMVEIINAISALIAIYVIKKIGRRTLLIFGHFTIAVIHALVGYFEIKGMSDSMLAMILLFIFVYQMTSDTMAFIYVTETTIDAALGICLLTLFGTIFLLSLITPIIMEPELLGLSNIFFLFSNLSGLATLYYIFIFKETKGLADILKFLGVNIFTFLYNSLSTDS